MEDDDPMLTALVLTVAVVGALVIRRAYQRQWHVRLRREIRALPERERPPERTVT